MKFLQTFWFIKTKKTYFGYQETATLVSYVTKQNKAVILLSKLHRISKIDSSTNKERKPVIINYYNEAKFGVDILDV